MEPKKMTVPRRRWQEMRAPDFSGDSSRWIAVLPIAAVEQHGPHLPVGVDMLLAEGYVAETIRRLPSDLPATFLPVQAVGKSNEHIASPGTLTLGWKTATESWIEIGDSIARAGLRKLVIVTSHGGNVPIMDIVALELRLRHRMLCVATGWSRLGKAEGVFPPEEAVHGIHGGDVETSMMLALHPELVDMNAAADFGSRQHEMIATMAQLRVHGPVQFGWTAGDLNPAGAVGNAGAATAEKGRAQIAYAASAFCDLLADVDRFDPDSLAH
jgi:creatinine amidohydrolase